MDLNKIMLNIMKKYLVFLIVIYIATFSITHEYEHANINKHIHEFHESSFNDYVHLASNHNALDTHESQHVSLHKHLDDLFLRSARQRKVDGKLFILSIFATQKTFLNLSQFVILKKPRINIHTTSYNTPFVSSNQPLLI